MVAPDEIPTTTQTGRVLQYMRDFGSISQREAIIDLGCYRLASRISDLRKAGVAIKVEQERATNRYGEPTHFARYRLDDATPADASGQLLLFAP